MATQKAASYLKKLLDKDRSVKKAYFRVDGNNLEVIVLVDKVNPKTNEKFMSLGLDVEEKYSRRPEIKILPANSGIANYIAA